MAMHGKLQKHEIRVYTSFQTSCTVFKRQLRGIKKRGENWEIFVEKSLI